MRGAPYSPMERALYADLPTSGAANYEGRTMAITTAVAKYTGDISEVRFRARRVSGLAEATCSIADGDRLPVRFGRGRWHHPGGRDHFGTAPLTRHGAERRSQGRRFPAVQGPKPSSASWSDQGEPAQSTDPNAMDVGSDFERPGSGDGDGGNWHLGNRERELTNPTTSRGNVWSRARGDPVQRSSRQTRATAVESPRRVSVIIAACDGGHVSQCGSRKG